ncbi:11203_t:CDS:2, partial [Funneliformis mosseae]
MTHTHRLNDHKLPICQMLSMSHKIEAETGIFNFERDELDTSDHELNYICCLAVNVTILITSTLEVRLGKKNREEIDTAFKSMDEQYMWKISTGRFIEKELYRLGQKLEFEHAIHSFITDADDELISSHLNDTELEEIDYFTYLISQIKSLNFYMNSLASLNEIRETIKSKMFGINYDHKNYHDKDYIIYALIVIREVQGGSMKNTKLEVWFNCHIWSVIFDQAFGDINVISVVRGESTSLAIAYRKNMKRKSEKRRKMGRRGDWIVRSVTNGDKHEFGAGEAGNVWTDDHRTKFLEAGLKLPKVLKDMLVKLMKKVDWNRERCAKCRRLELSMQLLMEVSDNPEKFPSVLKILASVLNLK